ncbi:MAG: hypothetical protein Q9195_006943 [Heterodermia aff. obscurata]
MDNKETGHRPPENDGVYESPSSSNRSKRHSSLTKSFSGLKRMGSKLVPSNWGKDGTKYEALDSTTSLLRSPPDLPGVPPPLNKDNDSKESFLTSLNKLADHPRYQSNPAPGLGHKKKEPVTHSDNDPDPDLSLAETSSKPLNTAPRPTAFTEEKSPAAKSTSFIPRYSNAPILFPSLMAPIRPGDEPRRSMPRSNTVGELERRQAASKEARSVKNNTANYMRPTSNSIARRSSAVSSPFTTTVPPSCKRRSPQHPLSVKVEQQRTNSQGSRLSSSNSSRAMRARATSDLPFRELYGSKAPADNKVQTASRPSRFMEDAHDALQLKSKIPKGTTSALSNVRQAAAGAAPTSTTAKPAGRDSSVIAPHRQPGHVIDFNAVKSPEFAVATTPKGNPSEEEAAEPREPGFYDFHDTPGHTPFLPPGSTHETLTAGELEYSRRRHQALDSPHSEAETVQQQHYEQGESSVKQGKQREQVGVDGGEPFVTHNRQDEIMGYYDEEGYTAPAMERENEEESFEGETVIRGGVGEDNTTSARSITMGANTEPVEEEEEDPRNVYTAMPQTWWAGRTSGLIDRFRNEALLSGDPTTHPMMDDSRRMRRVFTELAAFCKTPAAKQSLDEYARAYWVSQGRHPPPVPIIIPPATTPTLLAGQAKEKEGTAKKEKKGVLMKLGLRRKSGM